MTAPADLNQPDGPRAPLVPLPRYGAVQCPSCPTWVDSPSEWLDCPSCGGLRFVKVDVDSLRVWPAKEGEA